MNLKKEVKGFSLIELLIAMSVIGVLATTIAIAFIDTRLKSKIAKAKHDLTAIHRAIMMMSNDTGEWPNHQLIDSTDSGIGNEICEDGCDYGISDPEAGLTSSDGSYLGWSGPYIRAINLDPWGREYFFDTDYYIERETSEPCDIIPLLRPLLCDIAVVIGSYGADGIGINEYTEDDIIKIIAK